MDSTACVKRVATHSSVCCLSGDGTVDANALRPPTCPIFQQMLSDACPKEVSSCPLKAESLGRRTLSVKVHCAIQGTRAPSPHGQGQDTQPRLIFALWVGMYHLLAGGASPDPLNLPLPMSPCLCSCSVAQLCPTLRDPTDCSLPGSSVRGILQARILECVAMPSSRGSS